MRCRLPIEPRRGQPASDGRLLAAVVLSTALCGPGVVTAADRATFEDRPYPGTIGLAVDLTDAPRRIFRVHESIPVKPGPLVLLYPKWIPGEHGPSGPLVAIAGLKITADGQRISWRRDPREMYALNLKVPARVHSVDLEFQFLSPAAGGLFGQGVAATDRLVALEWNQVVLYPAGFLARQVTVQPSVVLPDSWGFATALERAGADGGTTRFDAVNLETLVDSPLIAGRNFKRIDLSLSGAPPVYLDIVADRPENLAASPEQLQQHRALVREAAALFGTQHYRHYDFLVTLSDHTAQFGLEHHQSSDDRTDAEFFTNPARYTAGATLLPHEYVHSWNGKFRRPAGLIAPNFNAPMDDDLLWVYEGLTSYYGGVLAARSGMWKPVQFREYLAVVAARMSHVPGRSWRPLQDTADEAQVLYQSPRAWRNWRRGVDFYDEGSLVWLDVDSTIREASGGARTLDDFAKAFYGSDAGRLGPIAYWYEDLIEALNRTQKYDWRTFLDRRLQSTEAAPPLDGLARCGWKLVYMEEPSEYEKADEMARKVINLTSSVGLLIGSRDGDEGDGARADPDTVIDVLWGGPAFEAGVAPGMKLVAVNGNKFGGDILKDAVKAAQNGTQPIELLVEYAGSYLSIKLDYHGGNRYPHLERIEGAVDRLTAIAQPKAAPMR
jgi:predicted metalloprotease with PDZ domain